MRAPDVSTRFSPKKIAIHELFSPDYVLTKVNRWSPLVLYAFPLIGMDAPMPFMVYETLIFRSSDSIITLWSVVFSVDIRIVTATNASGDIGSAAHDISIGRRVYLPLVMRGWHAPGALWLP